MPDKFLIGMPFKTGLQNNVEQFMIMDDAFYNLRNAYVWRDKVMKRVGARVMVGSVSEELQQQYTRLRVLIDTTDVNGDATGTVPGTIVDTAGQMFSCGSEYYTVTAAGAPATLITNGSGALAYNTSGGGAGNFTLLGGPPETDLYFYPAFPVMHFERYERAALNDEKTIAWDTQFAYEFSNANGWQRLDGETNPGDGAWSGTDSDFYSTVNYRGPQSYEYYLFVVNNVVGDEIKYYDGTNWTQTTFEYDSVNNRDILTAQVVIGFKGRLLLLNTTEETAAGNQIFRNRVRYSQVGNPLEADAWHEGPAVVGKGGFIEAPTKQAIVGARIIRDRLIVFFERSTYELVFTNNKVLPFIFQELDSELGVESKNSLISFDRTILGFGSTGIHACNGVNVERIDEKIPEKVFQISNGNAGPNRVAGIRDYDNEMVYWSYPFSSLAVSNADTYPNRILVFNYKTRSWAEFDDSITAFGYHQLESDLTWEQLDIAWESYDEQWNDPSLTKLYRSVIAGNQQGWTFLMQQGVGQNSKSLQITNISVSDDTVTLTIYNHNLHVGDYIFINNVEDDDTLSDLNENIYEVVSTSTNSITITDTNGLSGTYEGGGTIQLVSGLVIRTKQFNFYVNQDSNIFIPQISIYCDKQTIGELVYELYASTSDLNITTDGFTNETLLGTNVIDFSPNALEPLEASQTQVWRQIYPNIEGNNISLEINYADQDILDPQYAFADFTFHGFIIYAIPTHEL